MAPIGSVTIRVLNAQNLDNKGLLSKSDPYILLELGEQEVKTKHKDDTLNPVWEEEFKMSVEADEQAVSLSLWDKNTVKKDNFMGYSYLLFDDCLQGQETRKTVEVLGGCTGQVNLVVTPDFETSGTKLHNLAIADKNKENEIKQMSGTIADRDAEVSKLGDQINVMGAENDRFKQNNDRLEKEVNRMGEENDKFAANNAKLEENVNRLEGEVDKMTEENNKFAENNKKLEGQVNKLEGEVSKMAEENNKFAENNKKLEAQVSQMEAENNKFAENNKKLEAENGKFAGKQQKVGGECK